MRLLHRVTFTADHRCFKKGDAFDLRDGVNLLVGDQGTGKSTLLQTIGSYSKARESERKIHIDLQPGITQCGMIRFDFEADTARGKSQFDDRIDFMAQVQSLFISHGQLNLAVNESLGKKQDHLILFDEPDMALSIRSAHKLAAILASAAGRNNQILAAVHNPVVIAAFPEVLSLEHRRWMPSAEFLESQKE